MFIVQALGHTPTVVNYAAVVVIYDCNTFIVQATGGKISDWKTIRTCFGAIIKRRLDIQPNNTQNNRTQHNNQNGKFT